MENSDHDNVALFGTHENVDSVVGSVYYGWGRIRLCHEDGPHISKTPVHGRFIVYDKQLHEFESWMNTDNNFKTKNADQKMTKLTELGCINIRYGFGDKFCKDNNPRLVEIIDSDINHHVHISRGYPFRLGLKECDSEKLYNFVNSLSGSPEEKNIKLRDFIWDDKNKSLREGLELVLISSR